MKLGIGLVVKGGKEFIDKWIESAERFRCQLFVVDNDADIEVKAKLINHPHTKQYHIQKYMERNQSRDYQKILEMAREENVDWIFNVDIDEYIPDFDLECFLGYLLNTKDISIGFPLLEMRNDDNHYVMIKDCTDKLKHARCCHKCYKVLSHLKFNEKDTHGISVPHNCPSGEVFFMPIKHFGHYTKELRDKKREFYNEQNFKDLSEQEGNWMKEDNEIEIKELNKEMFPILK